MSFWDHLKPTPRLAALQSATLEANEQAVVLGWEDGFSCRLSSQKLRQHCPCAECVDEGTGRRTLDVAAVPANLKILEIEPVGRYALRFTFGDLHGVGLFPFRLLRELATMSPKEDNV